MKLHIIVVRDSGADVFGQPQFVPSLGNATRAFGDQVNSKDSGVLYNHPEDFALYVLGEFDDNTAEFDLLPQPRQLVRGQDVKRSE